MNSFPICHGPPLSGRCSGFCPIQPNSYLLAVWTSAEIFSEGGNILGRNIQIDGKERTKVLITKIELLKVSIF